MNPPKLSFEQLSQGITHCIKNAAALVQEARLLKDNGSLGRAMTLAHSALEEIGKTHVLGHMAQIEDDRPQDWVEKWRGFRSHPDKNTFGMMDLLPDSMRDKGPEMLKAAIEYREKQAKQSERTRQDGLYVDFDSGQNQWKSPLDVTLRQAEEAIQESEQALKRAQIFETLGLHSARALELQNEILGPMRTMLRAAGPDPEAVARVLDKEQNSAMKKYISKLLEEGIVDKSSDLQFLGVPLSEHSGANDSASS